MWHASSMEGVTANWLRLPERAGVALVGWCYGDHGSEAKVAEILQADSLAWERLRRRIELSNGDLVLLQAPAGEEIRELDTFGEGMRLSGTA